ncbi:hypothetical protein AWENTII_011481 [Aspergillus wentii]
MHTPDKNEFPLPSLELLMLQWHLQRITGLRGAAEVFDDDDDEDDYYDCEGVVEAGPFPKLF